MKKLRNIILGLISYMFFYFIFNNYQLLTNPDQKLVTTLYNTKYFNWKLKFLDWMGADPKYNNYSGYQVMLLRQNYGLFNRYYNEESRDNRKIILCNMSNYKLTPKLSIELESYKCNENMNKLLE